MILLLVCLVILGLLFDYFHLLDWFCVRLLFLICAIVLLLCCWLFCLFVTFTGLC